MKYKKTIERILTTSLMIFTTFAAQDALASHKRSFEEYNNEEPDDNDDDALKKRRRRIEDGDLLLARQLQKEERIYSERDRYKEQDEVKEAKNNPFEIIDLTDEDNDDSLIIIPPQLSNRLENPQPGNQALLLQPVSNPLRHPSMPMYNHNVNNNYQQPASMNIDNNNVWPTGFNHRQVPNMHHNYQQPAGMNIDNNNVWPMGFNHRQVSLVNYNQPPIGIGTIYQQLHQQNLQQQAQAGLTQQQKQLLLAQQHPPQLQEQHELYLQPRRNHIQQVHQRFQQPARPLLARNILNKEPKAWNYNPQNAQNATAEEKQLYEAIRMKILDLSEKISPTVRDRVRGNIDDTETLHKNNIEICHELFTHKWTYSQKFPGITLHGEHSDANLELRATNMYLTLLSAWTALCEADDERLFLDFFNNAFISNDRNVCLEGRNKAIDTWHQKNRQILTSLGFSADALIRQKTVQENILENAQSILNRYMESSENGRKLKEIKRVLAQHQAEIEELKFTAQKYGHDYQAKIDLKQIVVEACQTHEAKLASRFENKELYRNMLQDITAALLNKQAKDGHITYAMIIDILQVQLLWDLE
jgi:hypothetical protein